MADPQTLTESKPSVYSLMAKIMHWGFALVFAYGISKQVQEIEQLQDIALLRFEMLFAAAFLLLLLLRFVYMKTTQRSALPANTPVWQRRAAKCVHYGMYISLAAIALSGLGIGGLLLMEIQSPSILEVSIALHEFSISLCYALIAIHIAAACWHRLLKDGVWSAMVPLWREKKQPSNNESLQ